MKKIIAMMFVSMFAVSCAHKGCGSCDAKKTEGKACACGKDAANCTCAK